jgi:hypothetical protein
MPWPASRTAKAKRFSSLSELDLTDGLQAFDGWQGQSDLRFVSKAALMVSFDLRSLQSGIDWEKNSYCIYFKLASKRLILSKFNFDFR